MRVKRINSEVFVVENRLAMVNRPLLEKLKKESKKAPRKRVRLNIHQNLDDPIHEMFIIHTKDTYIRPHKHLRKNESLHILEGRADIILFDDEGSITDVIPTGDFASGKIFYFHLSQSVYHSLVIKSDYLVFKETANGPYKKSETIFAPWSPDEADKKKIKVYMMNLSDAVTRYLKREIGHPC